MTLWYEYFANTVNNFIICVLLIFIWFDGVDRANLCEYWRHAYTTLSFL